MSARARNSAAGHGAGRDRRHHFTSAWRRARSLGDRARHGWVAVIRPPRLRGRTHDRARRDALLWRDLGPARRPGLGAGGGSSARAQPIPDHRALPPRARGRWEGGRVLRQWWDHDEAAPAHDRTRAHERYAYVIRWRQHVWLCNAAAAPQLALNAATEPGLPASARPSI